MKTEFKVLGIDVSKANITTHTLSCFPNGGIKNYWNKTRNKTKLYPTFFATPDKKKKQQNAFDFASYVKEITPDYAVLEPTGNHYSRIWYQILQSLGVRVLWVGHVELKRYRAGKLLPNKSDEADALAMSAYILDPEHLTEVGGINPKFYLIHQPEPINQLRDLCQQLEHLARVQSPIINYSRQLLSWQFPEVANRKSNTQKRGSVPPLWGWLAKRIIYPVQQTVLNNKFENSIAKQYGIEILRLWTASADYTEDLRISDEIIKGAVENYRRLRNTLRYLLGALDGYTPDEAVLPVEMPSLETWVLHRLAELDDLVRKAYHEHDFKKVMSALLNFCSVDLSAVYFDIRKDSLYCDAPSDLRRRSARTVMAAILERLLSWLAPIMPFTTEEAFLLSVFADRADSVHLLQMPETPLDWKDEALAARWEKIFRVRRVVTGAIEVERREKRIGSSLEAAPTVFVSAPDLLAAYQGEVAEDIFITSQAVLSADAAPDGAFQLADEASVAVLPGRASGIKCARSWKYFDPATADPDFPDVTARDAAAIREVRG